MLCPSESTLGSYSYLTFTKLHRGLEAVLVVFTQPSSKTRLGLTCPCLHVGPFPCSCLHRPQPLSCFSVSGQNCLRDTCKAEAPVSRGSGASVSTAALVLPSASWNKLVTGQPSANIVIGEAVHLRLCVAVCRGVHVGVRPTYEVVCSPLRTRGSHAWWKAPWSMGFSCQCHALLL